MSSKDNYDRPWSDDGGTSFEARPSAEQAATQRARVLEYIREHDGATDDELIVGLSLEPMSIHPRRWALMHDGFIEDSGKRRLTRKGRNAIVWRARKVGARVCDDCRAITFPVGGKCEAHEQGDA